MKRPDLSGDGHYDGWQAVDPTPQEKSDGGTTDCVAAHYDLFLLFTLFTMLLLTPSLS